MLSVTMAQLSGGNLIHDVGYMESGLTCSYEMIVLTDELVGNDSQPNKGIEVSPATLLVEEIDKVGPGGHYLDADSTLKNFASFGTRGC